MISDLVTKIIAYENGEMNEERMISFFQELIDSGVAWKLQGSYVRAAEDLIEQGLCYLPKDA
jgi:hypothetical protein